jgi:hypothetical protein
LNVLVEVLKDNADLKAKVADSLPDLFSFAFSSLKGLKSKYGVDSHQFQASVYILDSTLYKVPLDIQCSFSVNQFSFLEIQWKITHCPTGNQ